MEIKVSKASWHYRLLDFKDRYLDIGGRKPRTICSYFWGVVFAPLKIALVWCFLTITDLFGLNLDANGDVYIKHRPAFWVAFVVLTIMLYLAIPYFLLFEAGNYEGLLVVGTFVFEVGCLMVVARKIYEIYDDRERSPARQGDSFMTLTWKMVKAGKRKVCPFIEYKEVS